MLSRTVRSPNEASSLSREHSARNLCKGQAVRPDRGGQRRWQAGDARTHRVVGEAAGQDDGSGIGVAATKNGPRRHERRVAARGARGTGDTYRCVNSA